MNMHKTLDRLANQKNSYSDQVNQLKRVTYIDNNKNYYKGAHSIIT